MFMLRHIDLTLVALATPILLLAGVPAAGYGIGAATWAILRILEGAVNRTAVASHELSQLLALRVGYRFVRIALLVLAVVLVEKMLGRSEGLTTLLVITFAFTAQLAGSVVHHLRPSLTL